MGLQLLNGSCVLCCFLCFYLLCAFTPILYSLSLLLSFIIQITSSLSLHCDKIAYRSKSHNVNLSTNERLSTYKSRPCTCFYLFNACIHPTPWDMWFSNFLFSKPSPPFQPQHPCWFSSSYHCLINISCLSGWSASSQSFLPICLLLYSNVDASANF